MIRILSFAAVALIFGATAAPAKPDRAFAAAQNACLVQMQQVSVTQPLPDFKPNRIPSYGHANRYHRPRYHRRRAGHRRWRRRSFDVGYFDPAIVQNSYSAARSDLLRDRAVRQRDTLMRATYDSCMRARGF